MDIRYGTINMSIDVLELVKKNDMHIPSEDSNRAILFGDPDPGVLKSIFINGVEYDETHDIFIRNNDVYTKNIIDYDKQVKHIHSKIKFEFGSMLEEFPEQVMSVKYLKGHEKVLELGGNIGRNSMIIAHILNQQNNSNFVSLECCTIDSQRLEYNRNLNGFRFYVVNAALSSRRLIQNGFETIPSDVDVAGCCRINTITWQELKDKYKIDFDTLVLDCEGAFYYILIDTPQILDNIKMIIMENDYFRVPEHKSFIQNMLKEKGFRVDYQKALTDHPTFKTIEDFYEVWLR
jgi:hypothetical protein